MTDHIELGFDLYCAMLTIHVRSGKFDPRIGALIRQLLLTEWNFSSTEIDQIIAKRASSISMDHPDWRLWVVRLYHRLKNQPVDQLKLLTELYALAILDQTLTGAENETISELGKLFQLTKEGITNFKKRGEVLSATLRRYMLDLKM